MATDVYKTPEWAFRNLSKNNVVEEIRWWEAQNIPWQIVQELRRRSNTNNIGQFATNNVVTDFQRQHASYRGPMTPWVRAFSNGTGNVVNKAVPVSEYLLKNNKLQVYDGFLFQGGEGFGNAYGFSNKGGVLSQDRAIIGYQANGEPHYIDQTYRSQFTYNVKTNSQQNATAPSVLPPPGIISVNVKTNKEMMATATIQWKCYSLAQLEYMTPFWLSPKINVFLEFGWNLYDMGSLLTFEKESCYKLILSPQLALDNYYRSLGNYGLITGIISNCNFTSEDGFVYTCNTEIISRQAMYAGYRVDNPTVSPIDEKVTVGKDGKETITINTIEYNTIKDFFANYLQFAKKIITETGENGNYINYILNHSDELSKVIGDSTFFNDRKSQAVGVVDNLPKKSKKENTGVFYRGQKENRMFMGRYPEVYGAAKLPWKQSVVYTTTSTIEAIDYGSPTINGKTYKVISYADKTTDFDYNDSGNDEVWFQLDFVFELINLFCSDSEGNNRIDIDDIIISAHPNLISCDKNVLIPNASAPKINKGRSGNGYLESVERNNSFATQYFWEDLKVSDKLKESDGIWKAAKKARDSFKTSGAYRDDLNAIINWLYYHHRTGDNNVNLAAFPLIKPVSVKGKVYEAGYYGFLKHLYISKSKLMEIGTDENLKTLEQIVTKILNIVNNAVDNFWNFEVVNNPLGGLAIIDKNLTLHKKSKIYAFTVGSTSNVIKKINFDVTLTKEQTNQVLYGSGQNSTNVADEIQKIANDATQSYSDRVSKITQISTGLPAIAYADRFDGLELQKTCKRIIDDLNKDERQNPFPPQQKTEGGAPHGPLKDQHLDIRKLQSYVKQDSDVLMMRVRMLESNEDPYGPDEGTAKFDWMMLNLPPSCKDKLREMLDDGDTYNNVAKYAGPADNFTVSLVFDGIMGFRMFQHFAIRNFPKPYIPENVIFMVLEVEHQLSAGKWETIVTAILKPAPNQNFEFVDV